MSIQIAVKFKDITAVPIAKQLGLSHRTLTNVRTYVHVLNCPLSKSYNYVNNTESAAREDNLIDPGQANSILR